VTGGDETAKERVGRVGLAQEFGVELAGQEKRMILQFDEFDQLPIRRHATENEPSLLELSAVGVVELVAMAMTLVDDEGAVKLGGPGADHKLAGLGTEAHRGAFLLDLFLLVQQGDDGIRSGEVEFSGVGFFEMENVAREFDGGNLHAQTQAEIGKLLFAGVLGGHDLPLDPPLAEAARNEDAAQTVKNLFGAEFLDLLGVNLLDLDAAIVGDTSMDYRLINRFIGVVQLDIFADDAKANPMLGGDELADDFLPMAHVGGRRVEPEKLADEIVHALALEHEGNLVNAVINILLLDDGFVRDVAEKGNFLAQLLVQGLLATANQNVGRDTDFAKFGDRLLGGLGF